MRFLSALLFCFSLLLPFSPQTVMAQGEVKAQKYAFVEVIDGDTIRVRSEGRVVSLRLLNLDTEETYHDDQGMRKRAEADFGAYVKQQQRGASKPTKYGTPFGEAARVYAEEFFKGIESVEVESDHPAEKTGTFGRILSYVFIVKDGKRIFYNVEAVRQGFSPYYVKYGRSRRFDKEFKAAEEEAKAAKRGMWGTWTEKKCYPDYEQRLKWWTERAKIYDAWRARVAKNETLPAEKQENLIDLSQVNALKRIRELAGKKVCIFGTINRIRHPNNKPSKVLFSVKRDMIDLILSGRVNDGGRFNREIGIGAGKVELEGNRINLTGGALELPSLPVLPIPKAQQGGNKPSKPAKASYSKRSGNSKISKLKWSDYGKISVQFRGRVGDIIRQISMECEINVVYGDLPSDHLNRQVRVYFSKISPGQAAQACAVAANLPCKLLGSDTLVLNAGTEMAAASELESANRARVFEQEQKIIAKLINGDSLSQAESVLLEVARAMHMGKR